MRGRSSSMGSLTGGAAARLEGHLHLDVRIDAIGNVMNLAARLCGEAKGGEILLDQKTLSKIDELVVTEPLEALVLKGLSRPVSAFKLVNRLPSSKEAFLGEIPSIMLIPNDTADRGEKPGAVLRDQLVKRFRISGLSSTG